MGFKTMSLLTCCLKVVTAPSSAALSSFSCCSQFLSAFSPLSSNTDSISSSWRPRSTSSSTMPASVALSRSPMRTRSLPDHSEFTQLLRPDILRVQSGSEQARAIRLCVCVCACVSARKQPVHLRLSMRHQCYRITVCHSECTDVLQITFTIMQKKKKKILNHSFTRSSS